MNIRKKGACDNTSILASDEIKPDKYVSEVKATPQVTSAGVPTHSRVYYICPRAKVTESKAPHNRWLTTTKPSQKQKGWHLVFVLIRM